MNETLNSSDARQAIQSPFANNTGPGWLALMITVVAMLVYTALLPALMENFQPSDFGALLVFFGFGVGAACFHVSGWLVFLIQSRVRACVFGLAITMFILLVLCVANSISSPFWNPNDAYWTIAIGPSISLVVQAAFWMMRELRGWYVSAVEWERTPLSIASIMLATVAIAATIATTKIALRFDGANSMDGITPYLIAAVSIVAINLVSCLTFVRLMLDPSKSGWFWGVVMSGAVLVGTGAICHLLDWIIRMNSWELTGLLTAELGLCTAIVAVATSLRLMNFSIWIASRRRVHS